MSKHTHGRSTRIAIASDHAGFDLKAELVEDLGSQGYEVIDLGTSNHESVDYPDYGQALARTVAAGAADCGVAICGSGIGISMAANRHPKIRAALCNNIETVRLARQHNDANVLALGARFLDAHLAKKMLIEFLTTSFEGGRHQRRVEKLGSG